MSIKVKLIKTDSDFLKKWGRVVTDVNGNDFYYMPYWFEKTGKGQYIKHNFDDLPEELKKRVVEMMVERFGKDKIAYKTIEKDGFKVVSDCKN